MTITPKLNVLYCVCNGLSRNIFDENYTYLKNKAQRAIGDIRTNIQKIIGPNKPFDLMTKLFDSQILPILEYGSEIWYPGKNLPELETVHLCFLKYILGVKRSTSSLITYGESGRFPLFMRQQDRAVKLWFRLKFSRDDKPKPWSQHMAYKNSKHIGGLLFQCY